MFAIEKSDFFGIEKVKLLNKQTVEYLSVIPAYGGNINELALFKNNTLHHIIDGDKTADSLSGKSENYYRGAKLSPFPNRIKNGTYSFEGKEYQLEQNNTPHALHGLCWNLPFSVKEQSAKLDSAKLVLHAEYKALHPGYPFTYHIEIEYVLNSAGFTCTTKVTNTGKQNIPIGDGWHPYFTLGSKIDLLKLQFPKGRQLEFDNTLIPTGNYSDTPLFQTQQLIGNTQLDNCLELENEISETRVIDEHRNVTIIIWQKGYPYLQAYTPPSRNSIAIEPMTCAPDAFNNKKGLIILQPGETREFSFGVRHG